MVVVQRLTKQGRLALLFATAVAVVPLIAVACKGRLAATECESLWSTARSTLTGVVERNRTCERDEDCELVEQPYGCLRSCDIAIGRSGRPQYSALG
jgi:hypothetical protein